jgi:hypothetical protein
VLLLYPVYLLATEVLHVVQAVQTGRHLKPSEVASAAISLVKALAILWVITIIMAVLEQYQALGRACLVMGSTCGGLAASRSALKKAVPSIAPAARAISQVVAQAAALESQVIEGSTGREAVVMLLSITCHVMMMITRLRNSWAPAPSRHRTSLAMPSPADEHPPLSSA